MVLVVLEGWLGEKQQEREWAKEQTLRSTTDPPKSKQNRFPSQQSCQRNKLFSEAMKLAFDRQKVFVIQGLFSQDPPAYSG